VLRRFSPDDVEPLAAILLHPDVAGWLGPPGADADDVAHAIGRYERHWGTYGFGRLAVVDRATGALVGRVGVMRQPAWTATDCKDEIGWAIDRRRWGEGLATEAAAAALHDVFDRVGLEQVVSFALPANTASIRVMEKLGLARRGEAGWKGQRHVWYSIAAQDFSRRVSARGA
jgi:RimJ/RimL family protein N-acetyltransferase